MDQEIKGMFPPFHAGNFSAPPHRSCVPPPSRRVDHKSSLLSFHSRDFMKPLMFFNVEGEDVFGEGSLSYENPAEVSAVKRIVERVRNVCRGGIQPEIAILTPYNSQKLLLTRELEIQSQSKTVVSTVDGFQGKEAAIVVFSTVRASAKSRSGIGFVKDLRRLNVVSLLSVFNSNVRIINYGF